MTDWSQPSLPGVELGPEPEPPEPISATRRRTIRNRQLIADGVHPATRQKLHGDAAALACVDCVHLSPRRLANGTVYKCARHYLGESFSAASDVRRSWPACVLYERRPPC